MSGKREAVLRGAFVTFARDGYLGASIDTIAEQAGVSTRTIYNHFTDKEQLFRLVLEESATRVADTHIALMDEHLGAAVDLEGSLTALALAWIAPAEDSAEHFALMRRIQAEREHLPKPAVEAWRRSGPLRVKQRLAEHLATFDQRGWLHLDDPQRAALQFASLVSQGESWVSGSATAHGEALRESVAAGVQLFLYGCASPTRRSKKTRAR